MLGGTTQLSYSSPTELRQLDIPDLYPTSPIANYDPMMIHYPTFLDLQYTRTFEETIQFLVNIHRLFPFLDIFTKWMRKCFY